MPRLPRVLATEGVATPQGPRLQSSADNTSGAILRAGTAVAGGLFEFAELERRERLAGASVETDDAINTFRRDYDAEKQRIREQGQPQTYHQDAELAFDNLSEAFGSALKYPESRALWQKKLNELKTQESIKTRAEGIRLQDAVTNSRAGLLDREDANASVFGATPQEREDALKRLTERDAQLVAMGVRPTSTLTQSYAQIDEAMARRDFDNPAARAQVIADLTAGKYTYLAPDAQIQLRDTLITRAHADTDAVRKEQDRIKRETADEGERSIVDFVRAREYAKAQDAIGRYGQFMSGEEKRSWQEYVTKAQTTKESDSNVRTNISLMVYTADTAATIESARAATIRAVGQGLLDANDGDKYLGHLQSAAKADRNRREDKALDAYHRQRSEVKDLVKEDLRVTGPLAALVQEAQQTYAMALDDMNRNVPVDAPGGEDPRAWYNRTKAQWVARVAQAAANRILQLERGIDEAALQQEKAQYEQTGGRPSKEFIDKLRRLRDAERIREEVAALEGLPKQGSDKQDEKGGKGGEKQSGGGKSFGYSK